MSKSKTAGLPANWQELLPVDESLLKRALDLLIQTLPGRYEKYTVDALVDKMQPRQTRSGVVAGLRIFWRASQPEMTIFYFLRAQNPSLDVAYCMTVGVLTMSESQIYGELQAICGYMATEPPQRLEVVSEYDPAPQGNAKLTNVFNQALTDGKLVFDGVINPGYPWPNSLNCWRIVV